jgi:hypothetical protein
MVDLDDIEAKAKACANSFDEGEAFQLAVGPDEVLEMVAAIRGPCPHCERDHHELRNELARLRERESAMITLHRIDPHMVDKFAEIVRQVTDDADRRAEERYGERIRDLEEKLHESYLK